MLHLQVENTGATWDAQAPEGTGLSNLRARLALMPHLDASLHIQTEPHRTLAEVRLRTTLAP